MAKIVESHEAAYLRANLDAFEAALEDSRLDPTAPLRKQFGPDWRTVLSFLGVQMRSLRTRHRASCARWAFWGFVLGALGTSVLYLFMLRRFM